MVLLEPCLFEKAAGRNVSFDPNVTQPNSVNANISQEERSCLLIESEATCIENLTSLDLLTPADPPEAPTKLQIGFIAAIFILNFAVPLAIFLYVIFRRQKQAKTLRQKTSSVRRSKNESSSKERINAVSKVDHEKYLSFHNISYSVTLNAAAKKAFKAKYGKEYKKQPNWNIKRILKGLNGSFEPGTLSAIMGPSGCGKSTLLDILADRRHQGYISGQVLVNGEQRTSQFKLEAAYVMQSDALFPYLTVREVFAYSAELRLPGHDWLQRDTAVQQVIKDLDLRKVADTRVGGEQIRKQIMQCSTIIVYSTIGGISGGQKRRVTVGQELITQPSLLFLDEPTTGLDAYSSLTLVKTLRKLADSRRTVVCTIHQPRPDIFALFDKLLLMKAGEIAYFGPVDNISNYFAQVGLQIPEGVNMADFVVDLTYSKEKSEMEASTNVVNRLVETYCKSELSTENLKVAEQLMQKTLPGLPPPLAAQSGARTRYRHSYTTQVYILLRRSYKNLSRNRAYFITVFLQSIQFLFYGLLFFALESSVLRGGWGYSFANDPEDEALVFPSFSNTQFLTFARAFLFQVLNTMAIIESVVIATAFLEKRIFLREHASGSYSHISYHLQWAIRFSVDAIWKSILATVFAYFLPQFTSLSAETAFFFLAVMAITSTVGSSLAFMMVSLVPDAEGASNVHNTIIGFMGLYSGFFLPPQLIPVFFIWAYYVSFLKYGFEALEWNQFANCSKAQFESFLQVDTTLNKWTNLLVYMAYPIIFHAIALLATFIRTRPRRYWTEHYPCCFKDRIFEEDEPCESTKGNAKAKVDNSNGSNTLPEEINEDVEEGAKGIGNESGEVTQT